MDKAYPIDLVVQTYPFEDEDLENILQFPVSDLAYFIDTLKSREVSSTQSRQQLSDGIEALINFIKGDSELSREDLIQRLEKILDN